MSTNVADMRKHALALSETKFIHLSIFHLYVMKLCFLSNCGYQTERPMNGINHFNQSLIFPKQLLTEQKLILETFLINNSCTCIKVLPNLTLNHNNPGK